MTSKKILIIGIFSMLILLFTTACNANNKAEDQQPIARTEFLMDTIVTLKIYDSQDEEILDLAIERLEEIDVSQSGFIADSDASLINDNAGIEPIQVSEDVYYVIEEAKKFAELTNGAYEPTIGPLVSLWNVMDVVNLEEMERDSIPREEEINEKLELVNYEDLKLLGDNKVYLEKDGMKLDIGGITKGYAADEVKRVFLENGVESALIDLGGNIYALGEKAGDKPWIIGITNPFEPRGSHIATIEVKDKSIVTSGDYERYFTYKGDKYHHIFDIETGYPADNELTSVSIISNDSIEADALSTAVFVMGAEDGLEFIENLKNTEAIFVTKKKEVIVTSGIKEQFNIIDDEFKLAN